VAEFDIDNAVCLSFDVEWAAPEVIADIVTALDERSLRATFFCTHEGIEVPGHERGIHPNFRRGGDTLAALELELGLPKFSTLSEQELFSLVINHTLKFCPEAQGVRTHSLFFELLILPAIKEAGLKYDSSYLLPFQPHLRPFDAMWNVTELPIYYMDHLDLVNGLTSFDLTELKADSQGMKIFNFHPQLFFLNSPDDAHYQKSKPNYNDAELLLKQRHKGKGVRNLTLDLLDHLAVRDDPPVTMLELANAWDLQNNKGEGEGSETKYRNKLND
jgi:hypothetical protein